MISDNTPMETTMKTIEPAVDQEQADAKEVLRLVSEGKRVTDPELRRRISERSQSLAAMPEHLTSWMSVSMAFSISTQGWNGKSRK